MERLVALVAVGGLALFGDVVSVEAQYPTIVEVIPGSKCMVLNLTHEQMIDPRLEVIVRDAPSTTASRVGTASATVAVRDPTVVRNGFVEMLFPNGRTGWIEARFVREWRPGPGTRPTCTPALMSNGAIGFQYR